MARWDWSTPAERWGGPRGRWSNMVGWFELEREMVTWRDGIGRRRLKGGVGPGVVGLIWWIGVNCVVLFE